MPSLISVAIAGSLGLLAYLLIPMVANLGSIETRLRVGRWEYKMAARLLKQFTYLRRVLSGYDVFPIAVDDEQKLLKLTLSSSYLGDDEEYPFNDPDNRIKRLFNKPVAVAFERVPAAVDAALAEWGYWVRQKRENAGLWDGDFDDTDVETTVDPYVPAGDGLHLVDPVDVFELVPNAVNPENVKSAEIFTAKRYEKYKSLVGVQEAIVGVMGFFTGVGGIGGLVFFQEKFLGENSSLEGPITDISLGVLPYPGWALDLVVTLV